jgi:hypothetical protein
MSSREKIGPNEGCGLGVIGGLWQADGYSFTLNTPRFDALMRSRGPDFWATPRV